jgi:LytS/YehU family sensor histidine kinase
VPAKMAIIPDLVKEKSLLMANSLITITSMLAFALGFARIIIMIEEYGDSDALVIVAFVYFPVLFFLITRWIFKQTKSILTLKNEKAKTELMHLKSQVNPHFFFNMLNNLYGWVDKDPVKAKKLILSLSDMMRYSIYEGEKDSVSLEEEVVYMQQYIELHRMRYHKEIDIQFVIDTPENPVHVMPLLFIILLENAFKHGVENLRENAFVHLKMVANDKQVVFEIANNFDPKEIPTTPGIGVQNLKRRLELVYPKKHSLILDSDNGIYKAKLTLEI